MIHLPCQVFKSIRPSTRLGTEWLFEGWKMQAMSKLKIWASLRRVLRASCFASKVLFHNVPRFQFAFCPLPKESSTLETRHQIGLVSVRTSDCS